MRQAFSHMYCCYRSLTAFYLCNNQTMKLSMRCVASYPSPGSSRSGSKTGRKKFNYLNNKRLVETEKGPRNRRTIRLRDDVFFHRRVQFRETIKDSVEKHIRYFPENVKKYVFFKSRGSMSVNTGFQGMRKAPGWVSKRILQIVEDDILKPKNRKHLIELIESTDVTSPTKEEWLRYADKNGRIKINLYYHPLVELHMRKFFTSRRCSERYRALQAFLVLNRNNFDICPPLRTWSLRQGPVRDEELVERGSQKELRDVVIELTEYQRSNMMPVFEKLTLEEKNEMIKNAEDNREAIRREYERERLFGAKIMCGVIALKEFRSMTNPAFTYYNQEFYKYIVKHGGSVEATLRRSKVEVPSWYSLPKEVQKKYYCFEQSTEMHPVGGAHLYIRYCSRDYGLTREKSMEKWAGLSELQKAALNFCFYAPISPPRRSSSAFARFYFKECHRHALVMTGRACGNRAFLRLARKKWLHMTADERAQYEETESFSSVFPLHPTASSSKGPAMDITSRSSAYEANGLEKRQLGTVSNAADDDDDDEDQENKEEENMVYFEDELLNDDEIEEEKRICELRAPLHTTIRQEENKSIVFTI